MLHPINLIVFGKYLPDLNSTLGAHFKPDRIKADVSWSKNTCSDQSTSKQIHGNKREHCSQTSATHVCIKDIATQTQEHLLSANTVHLQRTSFCFYIRSTQSPSFLINIVQLMIGPSVTEFVVSEERICQRVGKNKSVLLLTMPQ